MNNFRIRKLGEEKRLIWRKFKYYINFLIFISFWVIIFNMHAPESNISTKEEMTYIFHDYEWHSYILNSKTHWSSDSRSFLLNDKVPDKIKWDSSDNNTSNNNDLNKQWNITWNDDSVKNNQVSINNIMDDLWIDSDSNWSWNDDYLIINISDDNSNSKDNWWDSYSVEEDWSSLIIEKNNIREDSQNYEYDNLLSAKAFTFIVDGRVVPQLASRDELSIENSQAEESNYNVNFDYNKNNRSSHINQSGIIIIDNYKDCMTPWWYKISHWDNVLAYKQVDNAPDICNIERRYCWNWKLSWTFTQQWCYVNENYSYETFGEVKVTQKSQEMKGNTKQNSDWTVTVKSEEIAWWFVFDKPNRVSTNYSYDENNLREEEPWIEQTTRPHRGCTTPRWEKIEHWEVVLAFKHANWFSDAPCENQFRLCTMWELMWTFTESTCQTRDTSFIDWINGSPTRKTYSKEKLERVKQQIKNEENYYKNARKTEKRSLDSNTLDQILYILDQG